MWKEPYPSLKITLPALPLRCQKNGTLFMAPFSKMSAYFPILSSFMERCHIPKNTEGNLE